MPYSSSILPLGITKRAKPAFCPWSPLCYEYFPNTLKRAAAVYSADQPLIIFYFFDCAAGSLSSTTAA
nr:MAG TPA: contryphan [Caudoviricetes sp.]